MKKIIFLCLATSIVLLSVIVLNLAPFINGSTSAYDIACKEFADIYKYHEKLSLDELKLIDSNIKDNDDRKEYLDLLKEGKNKCYRDKARIGLEYAAFNINVVFGTTCSILGLLLYLGVENNNGKVIGIIGLSTGVVGFVLTFAYIIEDGIVITQDVLGKSYTSLSGRYSNASPKIDSDGAYLKWDDGKKSYVCIYYDKNNKDSFYRKFSNLGNKYLSYLTKVKYADKENNWKYGSRGCRTTSPYSSSTISWDDCKSLDDKKLQIPQIKYRDDKNNEVGDCDKLFIDHSSSYENYGNINTYNKVITAYVFSVFIVVIHIGLAIFGFLLFKESGNTPNSLPGTIQEKPPSETNIK